MSHNKIRVAGQSPNATGQVTVSLDNLNDVSGTPSTNDILQYDGTNWNPASVSASAAVSAIFIGRGESSAYTNSPQSTTSISAGNPVYVYDTSPVNTISGATVNTTNDWITSVTLPAGEYIFHGQSHFEFTSSSYAKYAFHDGSGYISQRGVIGDSRGSSNAGAATLCIGYYELTAQATVTFQFEYVGSVDTPANQGNTPAQYGLIYIEKVA